MASADETPIGELRWLVTLAQRAQAAQAVPGTGIDEPWIDLLQVRARITAKGPIVYWNSFATDTPISHVIRIRWVDILDNTHAIKRVTILPGGLLRTEIFRVRRYMEVGGRKRFADLECQAERFDQ